MYSMMVLMKQEALARQKREEADRLRVMALPAEEFNREMTYRQTKALERVANNPTTIEIKNHTSIF